MENNKVYTIKFSKSGIYQYANFIENKEGVLIKPVLFVKYQKDNIPDVSNVKTIKEIITILKKYSYNKKVEIWLINGIHPSINKKELNKLDFFESELKKIKDNFFKEMILPLVPKDYEFIYNDFYFEGKPLEKINFKLFRKLNHLAYQFLRKINLVKFNSFDCESGFEEDYLSYFN
jgi:hypothetical protein